MDSGLDVVTGGAGFIGSHLVEALLAKGRKVRVVDDFSSGRRENVPAGVDLIEGDVLTHAGAAVIDADVVYHLAAIPSVPRSIAEPLLSHRATAESTVALMEAAERAGVRRLVLASSAAIYGEGHALPQREDQKPSPRSPYAIAKLVSELYAEHWANHRSLEAVSLRFFNVYGPKQGLRSDYAAVPIFIRRLLNGDSVTIFGDGRQTRDFIFVDDVVRALISASASAVSGRVYNVATGQSVSVDHLVRTLAGIIGIPLQIEHLPARAGDIKDSQADVVAAWRDLGFSSTVSLEEGLRRTVAAFQQLD